MKTFLVEKAIVNIPIDSSLFTTTYWVLINVTSQTIISDKINYNKYLFVIGRYQVSPNRCTGTLFIYKMCKFILIPFKWGIKFEEFPYNNYVNFTATCIIQTAIDFK